MLLALKEKLCDNMDGDYDVIPWLFIYPGVLLNRFQIGLTTKRHTNDYVAE